MTSCKMLCRWISLVGILVIPAGCVNNSSRIANGLIYAKGDYTSETNAAIRGAILGRFPSGSPTKPLQNFLEGIGFACTWSGTEASLDYVIVCGIAEQQFLFMGSALNIEIKARQQLVADVTVSRGAAGL